MDPNLFHLDWERTFEALVGIVVLSFLVERACALLFESRWWIRLMDDKRVGEEPTKTAPPTPPSVDKPVNLRPGRNYPLKELISFGLALAVCWWWKFDAVSIILLSEHTQIIGMVVTAAIVAGGSKASVALFHNVLKIRSSAKEERQKLKEQDG